MGPISTHSIYFMDFLYYMNIVLEKKTSFHSQDIVVIYVVF